ncbi:hypothetical protein LRS06_22000 [Hymenobacter sp. J193]|uniref:hypothetical protein n=1 Tax=Hymenobacter sp. J193 TaxID=2898429 RepID=UPI002150E104|nr:hypothetical protein [Hymenobacter sp. J193]MCR5890404.1 hypothetical protein [Hymenobacter sp. J193]
MQEEHKGANQPNEEGESILDSYIFIRLSDEVCNVEWVANSEYLENTHSTSKIWALVATSTIHDGQRVTTEKEYVVDPKSKVLLPCAVPGPTGQRFNHRIKTSKWTS